MPKVRGHQGRWGSHRAVDGRHEANGPEDVEEKAEEEEQEKDVADPEAVF